MNYGSSTGLFPDSTNPLHEWMLMRGGLSRGLDIIDSRYIVVEYKMIFHTAQQLWS